MAESPLGQWSPVVKAAEAAWERYHSTVVMGGTADQRRWSFDQALKADERLGNAERLAAAAKRAAA